MVENSKLSNYTINKIIQCFCIDIPASKTDLRAKLVGSIEVDESYFGAKRQRGLHGRLKRGRGTLKQPVFGIFERNSSVFIQKLYLTVKGRLYEQLSLVKLH